MNKLNLNHIKKIVFAVLLMTPLLSYHPTQCGPFAGACQAGCAVTCTATVLATGPWSILAFGYCMGPCGTACLLSCFHHDTTITVLENDKTAEKNIADVQIGDMVGTFHNGAFAWTKVVRNIKKTGDFDFVQITANNETTGNHKQLSVTPIHGMVLLGDDNQVMLDTANHVVIGDKVVATNGDVLTVVDIKHDVMHERYTLETAEGTVIASGMFVSTLCAEELEGGKKPFNATIADWQKRHVFDDKNQRIIQ